MGAWVAKRLACQAAGLQVLGQVSERQTFCVTCFHFPTAAAIPSGYFTLSSKNENSPLPEDLLYFRALSSVAWLTGLCRNGNLFNFRLVPTSQLSR